MKVDYIDSRVKSIEVASYIIDTQSNNKMCTTKTFGVSKRHSSQGCDRKI